MPNPYVEQVDVGGTSYDIHDAGARTDKQDKTDNSLSTTSKTVVGAINEHEGDIAAISGDLGSKSSASAVTGNDAFTKINTVNNKVKTYPKIFNCVGVIANASNDNMQGTGVATVTLYASGLAKIDYQYTITTAGSSSATSNYFWGLNRNLLTIRNSSIPTITPISGGVATWYNPISGNNWSTFNNTYNGYGCSHIINGQFWCAARNYNGTDLGAYTVNNASSNQRICGTCYGTFTPE